MAVLINAELAIDEAFLVAVKRMANLDPLSREFARVHSDRLWNIVVPSDSRELRSPGRRDAIVAFCLAVAAAVAIKVPALFGVQLDEHKPADVGFYARNVPHVSRKMADGLPARLRGVGGAGRDPLSTAVPIHLTCHRKHILYEN